MKNLEKETIASISEDDIVLLVLSYNMGTKQETVRIARNGKNKLDNTRIVELLLSSMICQPTLGDIITTNNFLNI
jgi:hypothetical protein